jgi:hypothetical protein
LHADIASFGVDALLAFAGLWILIGIGLVPLRGASVLAALGLAYVTGTALVPVLLVALLVIGVPVTLVTFFIVVLACVVAGGFAARNSRIDVSQNWAAWRWLRTWRSWPAETWVIVVFVALFGAYSVIGMLGVYESPLVGWDSWSIWARKAQVLSLHDSLFHGFFTNESYSFAHLDYPLAYPVWESLHFRAAGAFDIQDVLRHVWLLLVGSIWGLAYLLRGRVRPVVWAPVLLLALLAPGISGQLRDGYADVPMALFACLGVVALGMWIDREEAGLLPLAAIMLAATANMKNEGLAATLAVLVVGGAVVAARKLNRKAYAAAAGAVVVALLPWRIWLAAHGIEGDMPVAKGLNPGYLLDRIDRVGPAIAAINGQFADPERWLFILPLATLVVVASLVSGVGRRVAAFYLGCFLLVWAAFVWSYWISPHDLEWHLATSVDRVVSIPMLVCLAAVLHLSGVLLAAFDWRPGARTGG